MRRIIVTAWLYAVLPAILLTLAGSNVWLLYKTGLGQYQGIDYKDLISILLTALGVLIAILAAVLAVLAVWGFTVIKSEAIKVAEIEAKKTSEAETKKTVDAELEKRKQEFQDLVAEINRRAFQSETSEDTADELARKFGE